MTRILATLARTTRTAARLARRTLAGPPCPHGCGERVSREELWNHRDLEHAGDKLP